MPVIDCHGHYGHLPYLVGPARIEDIEQTMTRFSLQQVWLASAAALGGDLAGGNAALAAAIAGHPNLRGYAVLNPLQLDLSLTEMQKYLPQRQFVGAKVHPAAGGHPPDSPQMRQLVTALLRFDKPLLVHLRGFDDLEPFVRLAGEFSTCRFLLAEMGGFDWWSAIRAVRNFPNVFVECGGPCADQDKIAQAIETVGPRRVVFGSGMPLTSPIYVLGMIRDAQVPAPIKDAILQRNVTRLSGR